MSTTAMADEQINKLLCKREKLYEKLMELHLSEDLSSEQQEEIGKLQQSILQLDKIILLVQNPKQPTHIVDTTNWKSFNEQTDDPKKFLHCLKAKLRAMEAPESKYADVLLSLCNANVILKLEPMREEGWETVEKYFIDQFTNKTSLIEDTIKLFQPRPKTQPISNWLQEIRQRFNKWEARTESAQEKCDSILNELLIQKLPSWLQEKVRMWQIQTSNTSWSVTQAFVTQLVNVYQLTHVGKSFNRKYKAGRA